MQRQRALERAPIADRFLCVGIGLSLAPDEAAKITAVAPDSIAARAGFKAGDEFISFAGQPLISIADFSWVLHRAPESGAVPVTVKQNGATTALTLALPAGWRTKSDISKRVGTWSMRAMAFGGMTLTDLDDAARKERGLAPDSLALLVKGMGQFNNKHGTAKKAGFLKDDVIVEFAGENSRLTEGELIGRVLATTKLGETVEVTVLRGRERMALKLPMQ